MSSEFRILCMNHDPAIVVDHDWHTAAEAIAVACDPASHELAAPHKNCDLLVGRYSYPLVEVCCPAGNGEFAHGRHMKSIWLSRDYIALLAAAVAVEGNARLDSAVEQIAQFGCWTPERLRRLRNELGIEP